LVLRCILLGFNSSHFWQYIKIITSSIIFTSNEVQILDLQIVNQEQLTLQVKR